jgi:hypothetical protein
MLMRIYFESSGAKTYAVRRVVRREVPQTMRVWT